MDKVLVVVGSLLAAAALAAGVTSADTPREEPALFPRAVVLRPPPAVGVAKPGDAPQPANPPLPQPTDPPSADGALDWLVLTSYEYQPGLKSLPDAIKALEGKTVVMRGFIMPLYEFDDIHEFVLVPNHMSCCFGMPTGINGQVQVKLASKRGLPNTNEPIEVTGTFHAVETKESGYVLSIFRIDGAKARIVGY